MADTQIRGLGTSSAPLSYTVPGAQEIVLKSLFASFDGTAASGTFLPCIRILAPGGGVVGEYVAGSAVGVGSSAEVSFAPFLTRGLSSSTITLAILDLVDFNPVPGFIEVTSTDPDNPTTIAASNSVVYDGVTTIKVDFYASAIDLDQRGKTGQAGALLEIYRDSTALGVIFDMNASPGLYGIQSCYVSMFDTPSAGSHTYTLKGYKTVGFGSLGQSFVYGSNIATSHVTRPGFLVIYRAQQV